MHISCFIDTRVKTFPINDFVIYRKDTKDREMNKGGEDKRQDLEQIRFNKVITSVNCKRIKLSGTAKKNSTQWKRNFRVQKFFQTKHQQKHRRIVVREKKFLFIFTEMRLFFHALYFIFICRTFSAKFPTADFQMYKKPNLFKVMNNFSIHCRVEFKLQHYNET